MSVTTSLISWSLPSPGMISPKAPGAAFSSVSPVTMDICMAVTSDMLLIDPLFVAIIDDIDPVSSPKSTPSALTKVPFGSRLITENLTS